MSKFSIHSEKPKWKPKDGALLLSDGNIMVEVGDIHSISGENWVWLLPDQGRRFRIPVRDLVHTIRENKWRIIKDGPIEPEKILKQFKFI
jgi:hypothetical protein